MRSEEWSLLVERNIGVLGNAISARLLEPRRGKGKNMTRIMFRRWIRAGLIGMILGSAGVAFGQTNLIQNGSFERPVAPYQRYRPFSTGRTFSHWQVIGDSGNVAVMNGAFTWPQATSFPAQAGSQHLDLTGEHNTATGVAQTVNTTPGAAYTLTFYVGNMYDPNGILGVTSTVNVLVDGQQVFQATNSRGKVRTALTWQKFTTTIVATSSQTTIAFVNGDPPSDSHNGLDAVRLVPQGK